ncbi:hypothetical protein N801_10595 [Knoellia aerolata DSM 18566]|uniref:Peptidoglycan recognition protein family domain-containing protein n=1 Tax=Knoellia aerolata DSM 18566 TaxID=1385519 RepID=A0A0A0JZC6_9MICO|nr:hypothetical protein N801_10595 [Knoellia aerolata DSM 18566]
MEDGATALGVEWSGQAGPVLVQWRFTPRGGSASAWSELPVEEHGPDPGTAESRSSRRASDPVLTTDPGSVEFRILGASVARGMQAFRQPVPSASTLRSAAAAAAVESVGTSAPAIRSRAAWGADESLRRGGPSYGAVKGEVVHHTVNANTYAADDVPALIRAIYQYHVVKNGWNDIGYNFLIDRFGRVWEGRHGGADRPVVGAHSPGVNSWTTAAAAIGDFSRSGTTVPAAVTTAYRDLFAWKARLHQLDPDWTVNLGGETQRSISGHRDNTGTECPGAALYARIPAITSATSAATPNSPALTVRRDADNGGGNDVLARDGQGRLALATADETGALQDPRTKTTLDPAGLDQLRIAGDWDGDGAVDVLGRVVSSGDLNLYAGDGAGGFKPPVRVGNGWNTMRIMTTVGDLTGDRHPDIVAATKVDSELRVYPGNGRGGFLAPRVIGNRWNGVASLVGVGDWDRDGDSDLMGVTTRGVPIVYANSGTGLLANGPQLNFQAPSGAIVTAVGDVTGDALVDLVVKDAAGTVRVAASTADRAVIRWVAQSAETALAWQDLTPYGG